MNIEIDHGVKQTTSDTQEIKANSRVIKGFSKLTKLEKINFVSENFFTDSKRAKNDLLKFWHSDENVQKVIDDFSENTLSNYFFPIGVVPNVVINDKVFCGICSERSTRYRNYNC